MRWFSRKICEKTLGIQPAGPYDVSLGELFDESKHEFYESRSFEQLACSALLQILKAQDFPTDETKALKAELERRSGDTPEERQRCQNIAWNKLTARKAALKTKDMDLKV